MKNLLRFQMSGRLILGGGALAELSEAVRTLGSEHPMIVTDPGVANAGLVDTTVGVLKEEGIRVEIFDGVEPDPRMEIVGECAERSAAVGADLLIGLGGGSSLDVAKVAAALVVHGGDVADYVGIGNVPGKGLNTVLIPTTAGTGSEVTPIAVLSDKKEHLKKGAVSPHLLADVALVDPDLTIGLPPHITAYTGMDALTHAMEAYTNRHSQPFVDVLALEAIRLIGSNLRRAVACGEDRQARYNMSLGSLTAGLCLGPVNTAAVHALAYPLGGTFDVAHGIANSLLLPYVTEFNLISDLERYATIARVLGEETGGLSMRQAAERCVSAVTQLAADVGIVSRMRDLEIPQDAIDDMASAAMKVTRLLNNNPRTVTLEDARRIYQRAW